MNLAQQDRYAAEIRRIYANAETTMLERLTKRLVKGIEQLSWTERKLAEVAVLRRDFEQIIGKLRKLDPKIERMIQLAARDGAAGAISDLKAARLDVLNADVAAYSRGAGVRALATAVTGSIDAGRGQIVRRMLDIYRSVVVDATGQVLVGTKTRREAAQQALNQWTKRGIGAFTDKRGRRWDLASYAEMAIRTSAGNAQVTGHLDKLEQNGRDLVIVSAHGDCCPLCEPWQGRILSISGDTPGYPTVAQARAAGLLHPNCRHSMGVYIPGVTRKSTVKNNPLAYKQRQKQRANERAIRYWKQRQAIGTDDAAKRTAGTKVKEWQARQRELISKTGGRRDYGRETITRAR
jgi:hypothetical protein